MSIQCDNLFRGRPISDFLTRRQEACLMEIDGFTTDYLLNAGLDDLLDYVANKYRLEPVTLSETPEIAEHGETESPSDQGTTFACFVVPFEGNSEILHHQPPTHAVASPGGAISGHDLRITISRTDHDAAAMRREFDENLSSIRDHLAWGMPEITAFNDRLPHLARHRLESRKTKLLADKGMVSALGFPIRQRSAVPGIHSVRRKQLVIAKPVVPSSLNRLSKWNTTNTFSPSSPIWSWSSSAARIPSPA